ncbi:MAG: rhodanese-like domain-containing protein [Bacteroidia bacterium]|jgi:phage shock protein E
MVDLGHTFVKTKGKMLSILKKLFGTASVDLSQLIKEGAVIIDVRSKGEFSTGHAKGSINIPLEKIAADLEDLKKYNQIIVCCRSGNRSGAAKRTLEAKGFKNITNGGSWQNVNQYI